MSQFGISPLEQIRMFRKAGFEAFFTDWNEDLPKYRALADELGMIYQSVHAPFNAADTIWRDGNQADEAKNELIRCVNDSADVGVPIVIIHPYKGFENCAAITDEGIGRFRAVVTAAASRGVNIAFENVEGEEYLAVLMDAFKEYENVGFCWDSGHELCYNRGKDMLSVYGDRLIATHLNDNLGVSDEGGRIFWTDDLHLLPFDGITDWRSVCDRLNACGYDGILTFELTVNSKPHRHENDKYAKMSPEEYVAECYARACRVAYMKNGMN